MKTIAVGRQLVNGTPTGTGVRIDVTGVTARKLGQITGPLVSNPVTGEWGAQLVGSDETDGEYTVGLGIFTARNGGPPEHVHPAYEERFEVLEGEFVFSVDGVEKTLTPGEELTVPAGTAHTFRNDSDDVASCLVEARPAGQLIEVIATLFGMAHDGHLKANGQPEFWQGMVMTHELAEDTVFLSPPPILQTLLATVFAPIARIRGYRATYPEYLDDSFWAEHVEQPN